VERRLTSIERTRGSSRGRLTRALALLVLALTAFPFTAPCPVCNFAAVVRHQGSAPTLPVRLTHASGPGVSPAPSRAVEWTVVGEEPGDHDVLPVDAAAGTLRGPIPPLDARRVRPAEPRATPFLRAVPLRV